MRPVWWCWSGMEVEDRPRTDGEHLSEMASVAAGFSD